MTMVYFLRFDIPLGSPRHRAEFYCGYCKDGRLWQRIDEHSEGRGAAITRAAAQRGIGFSLVKTFPKATRHDERKFKQRKSHETIVRSPRTLTQWRAVWEAA